MLMSDQRESGLETRLHLALRAAGIRHSCQVWILGFRIDFQIERLLIETDGRTFHETAEAFEADRERDRRLAAAGYHVVRVTYRQVMFELDAVMSDILQMIRRGDHLRKYR